MADARTCLFGFGADHESLRGIISDIEWVHLSGDKSVDDLAGGQDIEFAVVNLESDGGLKTVRSLADKLPACRIIAIGEPDSRKIIAAMRAGCTQYVPMPVEEAELKSAFDSARPVPAGTRQTICVVGTSSGAGATTVVCNLALEMARRAGRCAVVDLDLEFGSVACAFDCEPRYTIADICSVGSSEHLDQTVLEDALTEVADVSLLCRPHGMEQVGQVDPSCVGKAIRLLGDMFPYVVVDLSRINGELGQAALQRADRVLIVVQLNVTCVRNAERIYRLALGCGIDAARIQIVVNRAESGGLLQASKVESFLKAPILAYLPNDYTRVRKALDIGVIEDDSNPVRLAVRDLLPKLAGEVVAEVPKPAGLFKRIAPFKKNKEKARGPRLRRYVMYGMYCVGAAAAITLLVLAMPWFTRVVGRLTSGTSL